MTPPALAELGGIAAATIVRVAARRLVRGPLRPSWSFRAEAFAALNRAMTDRSRTRGIRWLRTAQAAAPLRLPRDLAQVRFVPETAGGVPCLWALPAGATPAAAAARAIVYFHGGGYVIGSPDTHREIAARLATGTATPVLSVDYRLAPEHRFPAAHDDCLAAVRWLRARGGPAQRIVVAGDSAGGALAAATLLALRDAGEPLPAGGALLCPWVDPRADGGSMVAHEPYDFGDRALLLAWAHAYATEAEIAGPRLTLVDADLRGLPPLLVQAGGAEILLDQIRTFAARADAAGVPVTLEEWPEMFHDFQLNASFVPEGRPAVAAIVRFVAACVAAT